MASDSFGEGVGIAGGVGFVVVVRVGGDVAGAEKVFAGANVGCYDDCVWSCSSNCVWVVVDGGK